MKSLKKYILNRDGRFGEFGGCYVPEMLTEIMHTLRDEFFEAIKDKKFLDDLKDLYEQYSGRPTPLYFCENLTREVGGAQIYMKNEGLNHTGAHKINHCLGQVLLAKRMGKKRVIAETGAGQHGLATATVAAKFGLECTVYMGAKDVARQRPNVFWMQQLGATVVPVHDGGMILRDAINAALRDLISDPTGTHYLLGTVCGPNPYPVMNTFFQKIVGEEVAKKIDPDYLVACVGGGSNAMGLFYNFLDNKKVKMVAVEAGGKGVKGKMHAARFQGGRPGVVEGFKSYFLQDKDGQVGETHSISAGLDYSGVGPQLAYLKDLGRVRFTYALDKEVMKAYKMLALNEGVFAAMESTHALVEAIKIAKKLPKSKKVVFNCSGRGDKDLFIVTKELKDQDFNDFLKREIQ
jgi:tryptophan synthase beta chain